MKIKDLLKQQLQLDDEQLEIVMQIPEWKLFATHTIVKRADIEDLEERRKLWKKVLTRYDTTNN